MKIAVSSKLNDQENNAIQNFAAMGSKIAKQSNILTSDTVEQILEAPIATVVNTNNDPVIESIVKDLRKLTSQIIIPN